MKNTNLATIVTGGGRGIGKAIADTMAIEGPVMLVGRSQNSLQQSCDAISSQGGVADFCVGDVSWPATAKECLRKVAENGWTVRNLVCNAGIGKGGACTAIDHDTWRHMFAVNVHGTFYFVKACLPQMVENKAGNICIISSVAGLKGFKYDSAYCATKHALVGLAKSLALEYAKHGLIVVPICPGYVESDMTESKIASLIQHKGINRTAAEKLVAEQNPQRRIIPAAEIAEAVALVCSGKVPSLNGNPLVLTGGA